MASKVNRPSLSSSSVANQVSCASASASLCNCCRNLANSGFLKEKIKTAVWEALYPCVTRARDRSCWKFRIACHSALCMLVISVNCSACCSKDKNSQENKHSTTTQEQHTQPPNSSSS